MLYKNVNIHEAKTHFSKLIKQVADGGEVIICNADQPVAKLVAINAPVSQKRIPGALTGKMIIPDNFDELPDEFMNYFR